MAGSSELGMVEAVEAVVAEPEPMLTPLPAAQFAQRVGELLEALEAAVRELSAGGYENFAEQVMAWVSGLKISYGEELSGWASALEKDSRKPKAPPAICALRPNLHEAAKRLKEVLLTQWATSSSEAKPSVVAARKRTAKALACASAAKDKPVEKLPRKRAKTAPKAAEAAGVPADTSLPPADLSDALSPVVPPLVAAGTTTGGDIPVAVATVAASAPASGGAPAADGTTGLITAVATIASGEAAAAAAITHEGAEGGVTQAPPATESDSHVIAAAVECEVSEVALPDAVAAEATVVEPSVPDATVHDSAPTELELHAVPAAVVESALTDGVCDVEGGAPPIDAVASVLDGSVSDGADASQVASWVVAS